MQQSLRRLGVGTAQMNLNSAWVLAGSASWGSRSRCCRPSFAIFGRWCHYGAQRFGERSARWTGRRYSDHAIAVVVSVPATWKGLAICCTELSDCQRTTKTWVKWRSPRQCTIFWRTSRHASKWCCLSNLVVVRNSLPKNYNYNSHIFLSFL